MFCSCFIHISAAYGQQEPLMTSLEIKTAIKKLNVLASVLYIAAHPDDENTRLISYFSNHVQAESAYLSLTRGGGGQNLIGTELGPLLGVLRTNELLAARKVDGGLQYFSSAIDFGFSKTPDETLKIWNKEQVLDEMRVILNTFQPDILINRFDHRTPGTTHGHHTASAQLAVELFKAGPLNGWQPNALFFNTSWWFYGSKEKFEAADKSNMWQLNTGIFYPEHGMCNSEIATKSRSQHQCQGMGRASYRGTSVEYLEWLDGEQPPKKDDIFSGINTTWSRLDPNENISSKIDMIYRTFNLENPSASVPALLKVQQAIEALPNSVWKYRKLMDLKEIIRACMALYTQVTTDVSYVTNADSISFQIEIANQSPISLEIKQIKSSILDFNITPNDSLLTNHIFKQEHTCSTKRLKEYNSPYWLQAPYTFGNYHQPPQYIGSPLSRPMAMFEVECLIMGMPFSFNVPLRTKVVQPAFGEYFESSYHVPPVWIKPSVENEIFKPSETKSIDIEITAAQANQKGTVEVDMPTNWTADKQVRPFNIEKKGAKQIVKFKISAPSKNAQDIIQFKVRIQDKIYNQQVDFIEYPHISKQLVIQSNTIKLNCIDLKKSDGKIGYVQGAGDLVTNALQTMDYTVEEIDINRTTNVSLDQYKTIIVGIRALNVLEHMTINYEKLLQYVKRGGNLIIQYNTSHRLKVDQVGPYPIKLSRKRITDETAKMKFLDAKHPLLNHPNKITKDDFEGWVQERGLYFPEEWDAAYTPILSGHDPNEDPLEGGLLVANHGKGTFIYTGYSFFRQLPAGVPGAFRLFANLVSYKQNLDVK